MSEPLYFLDDELVDSTMGNVAPSLQPDPSLSLEEKTFKFSKETPFFAQSGGRFVLPLESSC